MDYDPALERYDTAIRSMFRLYHRQHGRELLAELGLTEEQAKRAFQDRPYPRTQQMLFEVIRRERAVLDAAVEMMRRYAKETGPTRQKHYRKDKIA
jgi:hypothetical protein